MSSVKTNRHFKFGDLLRLVRRFINKSAIPFIAPFVWKAVELDRVISKNLIKNKKFKILFIAQNGIAANHIKKFWPLLKDDPALEFSIADDRLVNKKISKSELRRVGNIPVVNIIYALFRNWDLVIFVNHPWGFGIWLAPFLKKVYINHGIWIGKINNDNLEDGVYGSGRVLRPYGKPFYDTMFATSYFEKEQAISFTPELLDRVTVTGYLRADEILKLQKEKRMEIRNKFGYGEDDIVVHIMSTWGASSLYQTMGEELLGQAVKLSNSYKFIFSLHPRHDEFGDIKERKRKDILKKYQDHGIMIADTLDWDEFIVASDIAVSDHTSLCLYYVLLEKPVILVPVSFGSFVKGSSFDQLQQIAVQLTHPDQLEHAIISSTKANTSGQYENFINKIWNHRGNAHLRYKDEIYKILKGSQ
ncbi:CDP-glycerol glycerophosphotransferase family protein [Methylotuvimicrobium sp. KM2]|uniref:CDP-glycerol glycerophosphotransferase family protein n=1 Tax=Methylotuvimicrobium sp. KM2 TaxID=3133976 RepID=UPI0031013778